jgi:hypothetical protein
VEKQAEGNYFFIGAHVKAFAIRPLKFRDKRHQPVTSFVSKAIVASVFA